MHFLLSNDDGINAPGLHALAVRLQREGRVTVVAPDRERSATSHAITVYYPLRVHSVPFAEGIRAYAVDGTPADCVRLGLEALLSDTDPCDAVISGINDGVNLGTDIIYSGTVSAAMEAAVMGVPALAVSLAEGSSPLPWEMAADIATHFSLQVATRGLAADTLLNINIPALPPADIRGTKVTRLGMRRYMDGVHRRTDPRGGTYYWRAGTAVDTEGQEGTDAQALAAGYVSLTPVHYDLTHYASLEVLQNWPLHPST